MFWLGIVVAIAAALAYGWWRSQNTFILMLRRIGFPPDRTDILEALVVKEGMNLGRMPEAARIEVLALEVRDLPQLDAAAYRQTSEYARLRDMASGALSSYMARGGR